MLLVFLLFLAFASTQIIGGLLGGGGGGLLGGIIGGGSSGGSNPFASLLGNLPSGSMLNLNQIAAIAGTLTGGSGTGGLTTQVIQNAVTMAGYMLPPGFDISQLSGFGAPPAPVVTPAPAPIQTAPVFVPQPPAVTNAPVVAPPPATNPPTDPPTQAPQPQPPAETPAPVAQTDAPTAAPQQANQPPVATQPPLGTPKPATTAGDDLNDVANIQSQKVSVGKAVQAEGLSTGATVGIVFVGILCCVLLGVLAFCIVTKYRNDEEATASQVYGTQSMPSVYGQVYGQPQQQQQQPNWQQQQQQGNWQQPIDASPSSANWGLTANQGIALANAEPVQQSYAVRDRFATAHDLPDINGGLRATAPSAQYGNSPTLSSSSPGANYVCQFCSKAYYYQNDLDQHLQIRHSGNV